MNVISVDVGSNSVRVAITQFVDQTQGQVLTSATQDIAVYNPSPHFFEQRSTQIWEVVCLCVKRCLRTLNMNYSSVSGLAFTATCSLVVVPQSDDSRVDKDVIMWMDHRAILEAQILSQTEDPILKQFGGVCSPEFSIAKLIWLRNNKPDIFHSAAGFLELPDWLSWRSIHGDESEKENKWTLHQYQRSLCCLGCKWGFDTEKKRWPQVVLDQLGFRSHVDTLAIGEKTVLPGERIGYLSKKAALELGLVSSAEQLKGLEKTIAVSSSLIDAHSGVLAMLSLYLNQNPSLKPEELIEDTFCMIAGTSTCHMVLNKKRLETRGVWGPYLDVIIPGYYLREAGQSAAGKLIEHLIRSHADYERLSKGSSMKEIIMELNKALMEKRKKRMVNTLHVNPCFHGNRSPLADPTLKGGIYGLCLERTQLEDVYEAALESLAYETRFIIEELRLSAFKAVLMCGGLALNEMYMQIHSDVLNAKVISMNTEKADMMLIGSAILARQASLESGLSLDAISGLSLSDLKLKTCIPEPDYAKYHDAKYLCYRELVSTGQKIEEIMRKLEKV